ncbi:DUF6134 family protein [Chitinophaga costaii]|nr:DUF6134 family protein [Chitinophaga costaii]
MKYLLILICAFFIVKHADAQTQQYQIVFANHAVGFVNAKQVQQGSNRKIVIKSEFRILGSITTNLEVQFTDNILDHARNVRNKSGTDEITLTQHTGNSYNISHDNEKSVLPEAAVLHCVSELYFTEPAHITSIFSEAQGQILALKALGESRYELTLPDGKRNVYRYEKGKLVEVEINHTFGKAYIRLVS